ncbi:MAG: tyrosyl-tRNA synthetase [Thermoleophilia bacterium]|nr:tyrosyl-tRNA synthetase [Thermoleophilia bacterium]
MNTDAVDTTSPAPIAPEFVEAATRLARGCVDVLPEGALARALATAAADGRPLRVKFGMDPTSADVHLGHAVVLQKLREFQDAGHVVVLIIGDYTARVGDPSGRSKSRPVVGGDEIDANAKTYQEQAFRILRADRTEVRRNGEWLSTMTPAEMFTLMRTATVAQVLERDDIQKRMGEQAPIALLELLYPLLQGYDSVVIEADIEFGGTDQLFNLLMGRHLQPQYDQRPQLVMTTPILTGTDGVEKMSKSLGNYVGLDDEPNDVFGKVMSIPDEAMPEWYRYAAGIDWETAEGYVVALEGGTVHPNRAKRTLARHVVERFNGAGAAEAAEAQFDAQFQRHEVPDDIPDFDLGGIDLNDAGLVFLPALLVELGWAGSNGEARRLVQGGGVKLAGTPVAKDALEHSRETLAGNVLQAGKRRFVRLMAEASGP